MTGKGIRVLSLLCVVSLFGAACSKPARKTAAKPVETPVPFENVTPEPTVTPDAAAAKKPATTGKKTTGRLSNPSTNTAYATKLGANIKPQSVAYGPKGPNSWVGVTKDTIKLAFTYNKGACGTDLITAISAAGAQLDTGTRFYRPAPRDTAAQNAEIEEGIRWLVRGFNDTAFAGAEFLPQIRPLMGNDQNRQFFGRRLEYVTLDGGSFQPQCTDKTTASAADIVDREKPFAVLTNFDGTQYQMAITLKAKSETQPEKRPMHFGTLDLSDRVYRGLAPYAWTQFKSGTTQMDKFASYLCSTKVGEKAVRDPSQSSTANPGPTRKFGLATVNLEEAKQVVEDFRASLDKHCAGKGGKGIIADEFLYSPDPNRMPDEGQQMMVRFKVSGITSVIYLEPLAPIFHVGQAAAQSFYPEWVWPGLGYTDTAYVQRIYTSLNENEMNKASFGISAFGVPGGFGYGAGDPFWLYHRYNKGPAPDGKPCDPTSEFGMSRGNDKGENKNAAVEKYCKAPAATYVTWYYTFLPLVACIVFAGPDLNPTNCTGGLQNYPRTRYGGNGPTEDPRPALVGARPGQFYFIQDAVEWKWRTRYTSPYPEHKKGYVEWPDCQRHYFTWPNALSDSWEKGGPNYNKYCGDAKYAPPPIEETSNTGTAKWDDKDGYPATDNGRSPSDTS